MSKPVGAKNFRTCGLWQVAPYASKLTRRHRAAARADHAYARALREQTLYPQRIDALVAGQTHYRGNLCAKCGSVERRVYDNACWSCQRGRSHFAVDSRNRCVTRWKTKLSRAGYEARLSEKRREKSGESIGRWSSADGTATVTLYPGGRTHAVLSGVLDNPHFEKLSGREAGAARERYPALSEALFYAWGY
ncbi:hypothetical protein [Paraburkholderia caledonica]|uniref:Uncharacterized protein n=1 Tax=Paraburkholderia caledonica TaxID=134536 RepID=A0AB73I861_9BURK|nr:hypothetical protein [Paraburkholderia caledonica]